MGIDLNETSFTELWTLVFKRVVYLIAKLVSFKGLAFVTGCLLLTHGVISGAVWCSMILGIIANRTGGVMLEKHFKEKEDESEDFDEENSRVLDAHASHKRGGAASASSTGDSAERASRNGRKKLSELRAELSASD